MIIGGGRQIKSRFQKHDNCRSFALLSLSEAREWPRDDSQRRRPRVKRKSHIELVKLHKERNGKKRKNLRDGGNAILTGKKIEGQKNVMTGGGKNCVKDDKGKNS